MKKILLILMVICSFGCNRGIDKYNTLVDKDESCVSAWSDYESNLTRRADIIPQLVAVVKGSAAHENQTLKDVIEARASATQVKLDPKSDDFSDPEKFKAFTQAQSNLGGTLSRLMMVQEQYPDLKANAAFANLQVTIEGTENRLLRAREQYNKAVLSFNTELRHVSGKILNPITGKEFKPREYFHADDTAKAVPKVDFTK